MTPSRRLFLVIHRELCPERNHISYAVASVVTEECVRIYGSQADDAMRQLAAGRPGWLLEACTRMYAATALVSRESDAGKREAARREWVTFRREYRK